MFGEGTRIGKYELRRALGRGGFGMVYVARDTDLDRDCALKFLLPEHTSKPDILQRFLQEARSAAKIEHAGIVTVFEVGRHAQPGAPADGATFIAMELLKGESLEARNQHAGALPVAAALTITRQIASALSAAHAAGIVHRDIKPDNVFLVPDRDAPTGERVKLLDFGIAKLAEGTQTGVQTGSLMIFGTPRYMSPEQCRSSTSVTAASDIYSLGVMLFEMVCGERPFDGEPGALIALHQVVPPPTARSKRPELPAELDALIAAMLAKRPEDRPRSMDDVVRAIDGLRATLGLVSSGSMPVARAEPATPVPTLPLAPTVAPTPMPAPPVAPTVAVMRPARGSSRLWLIIGAVVVTAALAVFAVVMVTRKSSTALAASGPTVLEVGSTNVTLGEYKSTYSSRVNAGSGRAGKTQTALEALIRRELLAQEADRRGIAVTAEMVDDAIKHGKYFYGGGSVDLGAVVLDDGTWSFNKFKSWVASLNVSLEAYRAEQARGLAAQLGRDALASAIVVSRDDARRDYMHDRATVTYDVVRFSPKSYGRALRLADTDVQRVLLTQIAAIKQRYDDNVATYRAVKPQLQLRAITVALAAKDQLEAARRTILANPKKLATLARTLDRDEGQRASAGELGWHTAAMPMLGDKAIDDAVRSLRPGELTPVIVTDTAAWLVLAEAARQGDLVFDDVKLEIAAAYARELFADEAAKRAALAAAGAGKPLAAQFELDPSPPAVTPAPAVRSAPDEIRIVRASRDELPAFAEVKPTRVHYGPIRRDEPLPALDSSLATAVFETFAIGTAEPPRWVDGDYLLVELTARTTPTAADFERDADRYLQSTRAQRSEQGIHEWLRKRCAELSTAGEIHVQAELLRATDDAGNPMPSTYRPCMSLE